VLKSFGFDKFDLQRIDLFDFLLGDNNCGDGPSKGLFADVEGVIEVFLVENENEQRIRLVVFIFFADDIGKRIRGINVFDDKFFEYLLDDD